MISEMDDGGDRHSTGWVRIGSELWNLICCTILLLLLFAVGGSIFSWLERDAEIEHYEEDRLLYQHMQEMYELDICKTETLFKDTKLCRKQNAFTELLKMHMERNGKGLIDRGEWTFFGSTFFVGTLVTTVGYGSHHPRTPGGQLFSVVFGILGIPVMGYVISLIGNFVVNVWMPICPSIQARNRRVVVLCVLMILLILVGGSMFVTLEDWSFVEACYFSALTIMSVGFGDYVPTNTNSRIASTILVLLGLGVSASLIALLQIHVEIRGERFAKHIFAWYDNATRDAETP